MPRITRLLIAHENAEAWLGELKQRFAEVEILVVRGTHEIDAAKRFAPDIAYSCVTDGFPRDAHGRVADLASLDWVHVGGSGFDHFRGFAGSGRTLTNGAGVLAPFLAETLLGAMIALDRGFGTALEDRAAKRWQPRSFGGLAERTLAIIGTGAVGRALAARAKALGMLVIGVARTIRERPGFDDVRPLAALAQVAANTDYLSLNVSSTPETRHLVDGSILSAMRPTAFLLNAARGAVVDEAALVRALEQRAIAGAYLDVFETEPLPSPSPLWCLPNVLMTPHCSDRVADWEWRHARFFMDNLERWLGGQPLMNQVSDS